MLRAAAHLPALRAGGDPEDRGRTDDGADYDADSSGGIIRITLLRKRRENGLGRIAVDAHHTERAPPFLYAERQHQHPHGAPRPLPSAWADLGKGHGRLGRTHRLQPTGDTNLTSHSEITERDRNFGGSIGSVFEISPKHSIGAEFEYWRNNEKGPNDLYTDFTDAGVVTRTQKPLRHAQHPQQLFGDVQLHLQARHARVDALQLLADTRAAKRRPATTFQPHHPSPRPSTRPTATTVEPLRHHDRHAGPLDKEFSPRWTLRAGAVHLQRSLHATTRFYEYVKRTARGWSTTRASRSTIRRTSAAYGIASANLGRWSLVAGLRGEYTHTRGKGGDISQNYSASLPQRERLPMPLTKTGALLIAQYARTIERPRWSLNPQRFQISDYTYQTGNPELDPASEAGHQPDAGAQATSTPLTGGMTIQRDEIQQTIRPDADDPARLCLAWTNFDTTKNYYLTANAPFQFTKWWTMNLNLTYIRQGSASTSTAPKNITTSIS